MLKTITADFQPFSTTVGPSERITGHFVHSYDPEVYTGTAEEVALLQQKSVGAFKQAIASVLGASSLMAS